MFMPWFMSWCVNERTSWVHAFVDAKAATNDPILSLTKIISFSKFLRISGTFWETGGVLSVLSHQALKCIILTPLVKCAQNDPKMMHNSVIQWRMFDKPQLRQSDGEYENFKFFKEKSNTVPLHLLKSLCIPIQLMKSLSIPLLTLEIMTTTIGIVQPAADCFKLHQSRIQTSFDRAEPTKP